MPPVGIERLSTVLTVKERMTAPIFALQCTALRCAVPCSYLPICKVIDVVPVCGVQVIAIEIPKRANRGRPAQGRLAS